MGKQTPLTQVVTAIVTGAVDGDLDAINQALRDRYKIVRAQKSAIAAATVKVGDKVRIVNLRPKYLAGLTGTVVVDPMEQYRSRRSKTYFAVELSESSHARVQHKHRQRTVTGIPAQCVEVIG